jgi:Protein of unknown function (DUF3014)
MSRYDRNRSKKSNNTTFIIAIIISLLIGISGTYFVMENIKNLQAIVAENSGDATANEIAQSEEFPDERQNPIEDESELQPITPNPALAPNDNPLNQQVVLPDLLSSDDFIRQALFQLSPGLAQWLKADQLIRRYTVIANDFAQGSRISKHMSFLGLVEPFAVEQGATALTIAPKSILRYNNVAQTIQAIDAKVAVAFYQKIRPLMLQVFAEFSYPSDISLESIIKKAAGEILAAPVIEGEIDLVRPSVFYKFADPNLEALSPVQKQMIRMGPENTKIIQNKCREFLVELGKSSLK